MARRGGYFAAISRRETEQQAPLTILRILPKKCHFGACTVPGWKKLQIIPVQPDEVRRRHIDRTFAVVEGLGTGFYEVGPAVDLDIGKIEGRARGGDMDLSGRLHPVGFSGQPQWCRVRIVIVHLPADDHTAISDVVNVWWRRKALVEADKKARCTFAGPVTPQITRTRALIASCWIERPPIDVFIGHHLIARFSVGNCRGHDQ